MFSAVQVRRHPLHGQHAASDQGQVGFASVSRRTWRRGGHMAYEARHLHAHPPQDVRLFPHNARELFVRADGVVVAPAGARQPACSRKVSAAVGAVRADLGMPGSRRLPVLWLQVCTLVAK